jgi:hypothetical protein
MSRGRALAIVLAAGVVLALLVGVGRFERGHRADEENRGMRTVLAAVGPLDSPSLAAFRYLQNFQCVLYRRGGNPFALELCVDAQGRLVEAIDRRSGDPEIWSLRDDPSRASTRLDRAEVDRLLNRMGVPPAFLPTQRGDGS